MMWQEQLGASTNNLLAIYLRRSRSRLRCPGCYFGYFFYTQVPLYSRVYWIPGNYNILLTNTENFLCIGFLDIIIYILTNI